MNMKVFVADIIMVLYLFTYGKNQWADLVDVGIVSLVNTNVIKVYHRVRSITSDLFQSICLEASKILLLKHGPCLKSVYFQMRCHILV